MTVGNLTRPFERLFRAVVAEIPSLPKPIVVQRGHSDFTHADCEVYDFLAMDRFEELIASSKVLVMHAGAGSVIQALQAGKMPVVMPRRESYGEHVDDHQMEFAEALETAGKVVVARGAEDLKCAIRHALNWQRSIARSTGDSLLVSQISGIILKTKQVRHA